MNRVIYDFKIKDTKCCAFLFEVIMQIHET